MRGVGQSSGGSPTVGVCVCPCRSVKSPVTVKRINNIIEYLTFAVFAYTARGLYESDKFMFTLLLTLKIDMQKGKVKHQEFQTLIKGVSISSIVAWAVVYSCVFLVD